MDSKPSGSARSPSRSSCWYTSTSESWSDPWKINPIPTCTWETVATKRGSGRLDGDGDAVEHGVARERVDGQLVGEHVAVDAGVVGRDAHPRPGQAVAPAVGEADHARHDLVGDL